MNPTNPYSASGSRISKRYLAVAIAVVILSIVFSLRGYADEQRPSIVILIHGVRSSGSAADSGTYAYGAFRDWAAETIPNAAIIDFDWARCLESLW